MSEVLILRRAGAAMRVLVVRQPGRWTRRLIRRLHADGLAPGAIARRLGRRPSFVAAVLSPHAGLAPAAAPEIRSARLSWSAQVARATRELERAA